MNCISCDRPLVCAECSKPYAPPNERAYRAMYEPETAIPCPACDQPLVCKWCGHSYSGDASEFGED